MRRFLRITLLLGYVLLACTVLSARIEKDMAVRVILREVDHHIVTLPKSVLFQDSRGYHMYYLEQDTKGSAPVIREVRQAEYSVNKEEKTVILGGQGKKSLVMLASRQPKAGETAVALTQRTRIKDRFLLVSEEKEMIQQAAHAMSPFLEQEARYTLPLERPEDWRIYSLQEAQTFAQSLPDISLTLALLLLPVVLLTGSCILKSRRALWCNLGLSAASFAGGAMLLSRIKLPLSWLPADNIFRLSHYQKQMEQILAALKRLGETDLHYTWQSACTAAGWILAGAGMLSVAAVIAEYILFQKRNRL